MVLVMAMACGDKEPTSAAVEATGKPMPLSAEVLDATSALRMKDVVDTLSDDSHGGRVTGSPGYLLSMAYIHEQLEDIGLEPIGLEGDFVYPYPATLGTDFLQRDADGGISVASAEVAYDLVGRLPGSNPDKVNEHILVMAHYDHLGVDEDGNVFNGAFDNASGVAVALELARVLSLAPPERSVIFLITDEEESGLDGARAWLSDSTIPTEQIRFGLSVDPVGRPSMPDYMPTLIIGSERSPELQAAWREMAEWNEAPTVFLERDLVPVFASDQDELYKLDPPIPGFWFVNPGFSFYHTVNDTADTIDYRILKADVRFLANALTGISQSDLDYSFEPESLLDGQSAQDIKTLVSGIMTSKELSDGEREYAEWVITMLDEAIAADDLNVVGNIEGFSIAVAYFVMFELGEAHPGPIPPPFPEE
jgi:hypothetical protein